MQKGGISGAVAQTAVCWGVRGVWGLGLVEVACLSREKRNSVNMESPSLACLSPLLALSLSL